MGGVIKNICRKSFSGSNNSMCKGPEAERSTANAKKGQELQMRLKRQRLDHVGLFRPYEEFGFEVGMGGIRAEIVMRRF